MLFQVPKSYKGSFILNTLKCTLKAGQVVSISEQKLFAPDVKVAIRSKVLVPVEEGDFEESLSLKTGESLVINNTNKVIVLSNFVLRPKASLMISSEISKSGIFVSAEKQGYISIVPEDCDKSEVILKKEASKKKPKVKDSLSKIEKEEIKDKENFLIGEDRKVNPIVWDFRKQEAVVATKVSSCADPFIVNPENKEEIVEENKEEKVVEKKKPGRKKTSKKQQDTTVSSIKKEEKSDKKRKIEEDIAIEMDSKGDPIKKASDALQHLIDGITKSDDIIFVDKEQENEKLKERGLIDSEEND